MSLLLLQKIDSSLAFLNSMDNDTDSSPANPKRVSLGVIDTHIHLWNYDSICREWLNSNGLDLLRKTYSLQEYNHLFDSNKSATASAHPFNIELIAGVFMETDVNDIDIEQEIAEIQSLCEQTDNNLNGMIIKMNLTQAHSLFVARVLEHKHNQYIKGIRHVLLGQNVSQICEQTDLIRNLKYINEMNRNLNKNMNKNKNKNNSNNDNTKHTQKQNENENQNNSEFQFQFNGWVIDICVEIQALMDIEIWLKSATDTQFILDHCGNHHQIVDINNGEKNTNINANATENENENENESKSASLFSVWMASIADLCKYPNLSIKLSGLRGAQPGSRVSKEWTFDVQTTTVDFVLDRFAADRIVYGSDWPVSLLAFNGNEKRAQQFHQLWTGNLYTHIKDKYGQAVCDKIFVANAKRLYQI